MVPTLSAAHGLTSGGVTAPHNSLHDSAAFWEPGQWDGYTAEITSGTGAGQSMTIAANNEQCLMFNTSWAPVPDATSVYRITLNGVTYG